MDIYFGESRDSIHIILHKLVTNKIFHASLAQDTHITFCNQTIPYHTTLVTRSSRV